MAQESKLAYANGLKIEAGNHAFTTTGTTLAINTTLVYVLAAIGITKNSSGAAGRSVASCAVGAVTNGSVTFTRTDATSGDTLDYVLIGW